MKLLAPPSHSSFLNMDLSQLPEKDRQKMVQYIEEKQVQLVKLFPLLLFIRFFASLILRLTRPSNSCPFTPSW